MLCYISGGLNAQIANPDTNRIKLLLEKGTAYLDKRGSEKKDIDSGLFFAAQAQDLSHSLQQPVWEGRSDLLRSQLEREINEKEKGKGYILLAIDIFTRTDRKADLGDAYRELGAYYNAFSDSELPAKIRCFQQAEDLYRQARDTIAQAGALKDLGDFHQIEEKDSIALEELYRALALYQSVHYPKLQGTYDLIGYILYNDGNFNLALKYGLLAVETAEREKSDSAELITIYNRTGLTCYRLLQFQTAAYYFTKSYSIAIANHDTTDARFVSRDIMDTYLRQRKQRELLSLLSDCRSIYMTGNLADRVRYHSYSVLAYLLSNDHENARPHARELLHLVSDTTTKVGLLRSLYRAIIPFYLASGQFTDMSKYLPAYEKMCRKQNMMSGLSDDYLWWFKADSALGRYTDAIQHYQLYKEASDSALHEASNKQIAQFQVEYETRKKDQDIALKEKDIQLLTSQGALQRNELSQTRLVKNLTILGMALLSVIIGLLFNMYQLKKQTSDKLGSLVREKEWLLKEVHHRVKNNLQMVVSLLNSQTAYLQDDALGAIKDSQRRVQAMSLIHQKLYQTEGLATIPMPDYIQALTDYLRESCNAQQSIRFNLNIDDIELDVAQAIPVGLILNEAITNSIKYAFSGQDSGVVAVGMKMAGTHTVLLEISDNGSGLPEGFDSRKGNSLGMSLMHGLAKQLEGTLSIRSLDGLHIELRWPLHTMAENRQ